MGTIGHSLWIGFLVGVAGKFIRGNWMSFFFKQLTPFDIDDITAMSLAVHHSLLESADTVGISMKLLRPKETFRGGQRERVITSRCHYRAMVEPITRDKALHRQFYDAWVKYSAAQQLPAHRQLAWRAFVAVTTKAGVQAGAPDQLDAAWCYWVQQAGSNFVFKSAQRDEFEATYRNIVDPNA
jgi:hypothetical protein